MKIKITAFGYLTESIGKNQIEMDFVSDIATLKINLENQYPDLKNREYKIAVDKEIVIGNTKLNENCEIVLLPPFAGG